MLGSLETGEGEKEDGHGAEGKLAHDQLLTDPGSGGRFRREDQGRRAGRSPWAPRTAPTSSRRKPDGDILAMRRHRGDSPRLPNTHLVMHGSSSVPQELQDIINEFGGEMPQTLGVPVEEIQRGIKHGVRKINIDTDCRIAMTAAIRDTLGKNRGEFDPRKYLKPAQEAMRKVCVQRYEEFGAAGQASKIKAIPLSEMAKQYAAGSSIRGLPRREARRASLCIGVEGLCDIGARLVDTHIVIAPSILSADFARLGEEVARCPSRGRRRLD